MGARLAEMMQAAASDLRTAEVIAEQRPELAERTANALALKWEASGLLAAWLFASLDELVDAEEIEWHGRWCDDGGRSEDEP